ncbi:MAG: DUF3990 domain-containing protein [Erysipelotrichaceae bacterium]|nr:DUF3990 domain-containing protein [Erysipelotrichaceae bacterium]
MILYHTGEKKIIDPDIHHGRKNADFGWGFYLTPDKDFTYRWAKEEAVVNEYELDEEGLNIHVFKRNEEWFEYIYNNRRTMDLLTADVIIGPIANDTIFDTLGILSSGYLEAEDALKLLLVGPEYTQVAIKTEKALKQLTFIRSEKIRRIAPEEKKREQEAYQKAFGQQLVKIMHKYE